MYDFILQTSIIFSLGVIIYLIARGVPRVSQTGMPLVNQGAFDRFVSKLPLARIDAAMNSFLEKFLRKSKVLVMKIDNLINGWINKVRKPAEANPQSQSQQVSSEKPDLFDRPNNLT